MPPETSLYTTATIFKDWLARMTRHQFAPIGLDRSVVPAPRHKQRPPRA